MLVCSPVQAVVVEQSEKNPLKGDTRPSQAHEKDLVPC